jgi:hypothetical protein
MVSLTGDRNYELSQPGASVSWAEDIEGLRFEAGDSLRSSSSREKANALTEKDGC